MTIAQLLFKMISTIMKVESVRREVDLMKTLGWEDVINGGEHDVRCAKCHAMSGYVFNACN